MDAFQITVISLGSLFAIAFLVIAVLFAIVTGALTQRPEWRAVHTSVVVFNCATAFVVVGGAVLSLVQLVFATAFPDSTSEWGGTDGVYGAIRTVDGLVNAIVVLFGSYHASGVLLHVRRTLEGKFLSRLIGPVHAVLFGTGWVAVAVFVALPVILGAVFDQTEVRFGAYVADGASVLLSVVFTTVGMVLSAITLRMRLPGKKSLVLSMSFLGATLLYSISRTLIVAAEAVFTYWLAVHFDLGNLVLQAGYATVFFLQKGILLAYLILHIIIMSQPINTRLVGVGDVKR